MQIRVLCSLSAVVVLLCSCGSETAHDEQSADVSAEVPSATISALEPGQLKDVIGGYRGGPLIVKCWATWCAPCVAEIPAVRKVQETMGPQGLRIMAICMDAPDQLDSDVKPFLAKNGFEADHYYVPEEVSPTDFINALDPDWSGALPYMRIYDAEGNCVDAHAGGYTYEEMIAAVEPLVANQS